MQKTIEAKVPVRIDLAGGTLDIWPLYLLLDHALTVNLGIDLFAKTKIILTKAKNKILTLESIDQNIKEIYKLSDFDSKKLPHTLILHGKIFEYFYKKNPNKIKHSIHIQTEAKSPAGAGLGGSSALGISILSAITTLFEGKKSIQTFNQKARIIDLMKDIESQILKVPAGLQDYYGAMFGGLQSIEWLPREHKQKYYSKQTLKECENRILLFYSGKSRNSGINNWTLFKSFLDQNVDTIKKFNAILSATHALDQALKTKDWNKVSEAIEAEWNARTKLASSISTPEIDLAFKKALNLTPCSFKICGAGGGGCFFIFLKKPSIETKKRLIAHLTQNSDIIHLPFHVTDKGLLLKS